METETWLYLSYCIIIGCIVACLILYQPSGFWNHQPVIQSLSPTDTYQIGTLAPIPLHTITLRPNMRIDTIRPSSSTDQTNRLDETYSFLQREFSNYYTTQYAYLKTIWEDHPEVIVIQLRHHNDLIGCIISYPIHVSYRNHNLQPWYVDYLCVSSSYRNQNVASILIASLLNTVRQINRYSYFLFKKDTETLPFTPFFSSYYYLTDLRDKQYISSTPTTVHLADDIRENWKQYYSHMITQLSTYICYKHISESDFYRQYIDPATKTMECYIFKISESSTYLMLLGKKNEYRNRNRMGEDTRAGTCENPHSNPRTYRSFDVDTIIWNNTFPTLDSPTRNTIYALLRKAEFEFLVVPQHATTRKWIEDTHMTRANPYYYYLYNYYLPPLFENEFAMNTN